ncbi:molybdopterin-dependent oxidoreductase [Thermodesulfobacteriota bacterium]
MEKTETVKSVCGLCSGFCGMLITLEEGKPVAVKGDPENPSNRGGLCLIGQSALEYLKSPPRLSHPLKRAGKRGAGQWEAIPWDEALEYAADGLNRVKGDYGPQAVTVVHGAAKAFIDTLAVRFANAFGTPNVVCSDHVCHVPRSLAAELTFGFFPAPDLRHTPGCVVVWGVNRAETGIFRNKDFIQARAKGSRFIVVDPLQTPYTESADLWLQLKPGTDLVLALGLLYVIITEGLYDAGFIEKWTVGFDELRTHIKAYPPQKVAELTWVPAHLIKEAARLYATSGPACIGWGNGLDQTPDSFQANRALAILMAVTGNLDIQGGEVAGFTSGFRWCDAESDKGRIRGRWSAQMELRDRLTPERRKGRVSPHLLPDFRYVTPSAFYKSVLDGEPYPIRAAFVQASNPLSSWCNVRKARDAFTKLDFLIVSDLFMTPTAALADILFPAASFLEFDGIRMGPGGGLAQLQRKVTQVGECRSDHEILNGLAKRLGLGEFFWDNLQGVWDYILEPTGITFEQLCDMGGFKEKRPGGYEKYKEKGFMTPSGKVELYSSQLETLGFDPIPVYREPTLQTDNRIMTGEYNLLCTCRKVMPYQHSSGRQIDRLRKKHPDPVVIIHPDTAKEMGITDADWVCIESRTGRIRQRAQLSDGVDKRVIVAEHAWWFPERGHKEFFGFAESNYNALTSDESPFSPEVGSFIIRGVACKVYPEGA